MNIEQEIKEIEGQLSFAIADETKARTKIQSYKCGYHNGYQDGIRNAFNLIKDLQSEVERYKSLWEANAAESKEIIAELKAENEKKMKVINHYIKICDYILPKNEILRANILDSINLGELPPKQNH